MLLFLLLVLILNIVHIEIFIVISYIHIYIFFSIEIMKCLIFKRKKVLYNINDKKYEKLKFYEY